MNYVLVDFENVQPESVSLLQPEHFSLLIFIGASQKNMPISLARSTQMLGSRARYIQISGNGKNALDFHVALYIGELAALDPTAFFHIISKDSGFDPLIAHLKSRKIFSGRSISIPEIPLLKTASVEAPLSTASAGPVANSKQKSVQPPTKSTKVAPSTKRTAADLAELFVQNLNKPKSTRPVKESTLKSAIYAHFKKDIAEADVQAIVDAIESIRYLKVEDGKVHYLQPKPKVQ